MSIDSQTLNLTGSLKVTGDVKTNVSSKIGIGTDAPDAMVHVSNTHPKVHIEERDGGGTQTAVRLHANAHALNIEVGQEYAADSRANIVFSSMDGSHEHFRVVGSNSAVVMSSSLNVASNIETTNVRCNDLSLESFTLSVSQGFGDIINVNNETSNTVIFSNLLDSTTTTTGAVTITQGGLGVASNIHANNLYATNNVFAANAYITGMPVATVASNLVTWDSATGQVMDSGGLFSNKLTVVSEQPPTALTSNTYTDADHGLYQVLASSGSTEDYKAFDKNASTYWISATGYTGSSNVYTGAVALSGDTSAGEWLMMSLPYKTKVRHITLENGFNSESFPASAKVYASDDKITWTQLTSWSGATAASTHVVNATTAYRHYALVTLQVAGNYDKVSVGALKLFCESFSIDKGKIELASTTKSSDGTVFVEKRNSTPYLKYPREKLTSANQNGHAATSSSNYATYYPFKAFDSDLESTNIWLSAATYESNGYANLTTSSSMTVDGNTVQGEWLGIQLPEKIRLHESYYSTQSVAYSSYGQKRAPYDGMIVASNDGTTWTRLLSWTGKTDFSYSTLVSLGDIETKDYYDRYRLICKRTQPDVSGNNYFSVADWELHGVPMNNRSTGDDTVIHSVANTPTTDFLLAHYDAADYTSAPATLEDKANSYDLTKNGTVNYDSAYNAFVFSGTAGNYYKSSANFSTFSEAHNHTISLWLRPDFNQGDDPLLRYDPVYLGKEYSEGEVMTSNASAIAIFNTSFYWYSWNDDIIIPTSDFSMKKNQWYHIVLSFNGDTSDLGSKTIYVNGQALAKGGYSRSSLAASTESLNFTPTNCKLYLGAGGTNGSTSWKGAIANARVYDRALSKDEAWELFASQRDFFGVSTSDIVVKSGRVGINTDVPRAVLDVNGDVRVTGTVGFSGLGALEIPQSMNTYGGAGMIRYNTTSKSIQFHDGTSWKSIGGVSATGGTVTYADGYKIHTFTSSSDTLTVYNGGEVEYLMIAGGGGGGAQHGGAGGAGGYIAGTTLISTGSLTVTVGAGGAGGVNPNSGSNGTDTTFNGLTAIGGGAGGRGYDINSVDGFSGGSAGGGGPFASGGTASNSGAQGNDGGDGINDSSLAGHGGGGGGAGGAGGDGQTSGSAGAGISGAGGLGISSSITGTAVLRAGGGSGGRWSGTNTSPGTTGDVGTVEGGGGKGGATGASGYAAQSGTDGTGGGGGGGSDGGGTGGDGGDGIVIIRYLY